jgi:adenylate cyclase class 2
MKNVEIEIQAKIKNPKEVEAKLKKVGKFIKKREQVDEYFVPRNKNFFAKNPPIEYLRVRNEKGRSHLNYSYLHFRKDGWLKATDEYEAIIEDPETVSEIFKKLGFVLKVTVVKTRKYFNCGNFEVTIDRLKGLGDFMEVEAKKDLGGMEKTRKACQEFLNSLGVEYKVKKSMGYPRMLYDKLIRKKQFKN